MTSSAPSAPAPGDAVPAGKLHVDESGPRGAETVVFLHGGNVSGWMWGPQRDAMPDHHQLVPDMPGFGLSNAVPWRSMAETADRIASIIRERAHGGHAHVVGLSLGALVGAMLVARHPGVVRSAVLSGAPLRGLGPFMSWLARVQLKLWQSAAYWSTMGRGYHLDPDALKAFVEGGVGINPRSARRMTEQVNAGILGELGGFDGNPVAILGVAGGAESRVVTGALRHFLRAPNAEVRLAPGMHHVWNVENPDLFTDMVRAWIVEGRAHEELEAVPPHLLAAPRRERRQEQRG
ncbi:alpha/beta hydrolase [Microcella alkalica]|uniref:Pimeloyl-ACP methyl ester carboxylesterase n=1 Tax=Microcella alkalica TaxID=355930 RepID=A0A839E6W4_9MICO|nr:alpha/beta hydrolase [Microcella alkalica]MBA8848399.1 pimeloyl-ACP methyl ester carboxylesterase [Microcella alkalica]